MPDLDDTTWRSLSPPPPYTQLLPSDKLRAQEATCREYSSMAHKREGRNLTLHSVSGAPWLPVHDGKDATPDGQEHNEGRVMETAFAAGHYDEDGYREVEQVRVLLSAAALCLSLFSRIAVP